MKKLKKSRKKFFGKKVKKRKSQNKTCVLHIMVNSLQEQTLIVLARSHRNHGCLGAPQRPPGI